MWKCTVCNRENQDNVLTCLCGFDRRIDYENIRTFVKLDKENFQEYYTMKATAQELEKNKEEVRKLNVLRVLLPHTKLQGFVLIMGIILFFIYVNRDNVISSVLEADYAGEGAGLAILVPWIPLYLFGKGLSYKYKKSTIFLNIVSFVIKLLKIVSYTSFSFFPLAIIFDVIWSMEGLGSCVGDVEQWCLGSVWVARILIVAMSILEKQIEIQKPQKKFAFLRKKVKDFYLKLSKKSNS